MFEKQKRREAKLEREVTEILKVVKNEKRDPTRLGLQIVKVQKKSENW